MVGVNPQPSLIVYHRLECVVKLFFGLFYLSGRNVEKPHVTTGSHSPTFNKERAGRICHLFNPLHVSPNSILDDFLFVLGQTPLPFPRRKTPFWGHPIHSVRWRVLRISRQFFLNYFYKFII